MTAERAERASHPTQVELPIILYHHLFHPDLALFLVLPFYVPENGFAWHVFTIVALVHGLPSSLMRVKPLRGCLYLLTFGFHD